MFEVTNVEAAKLNHVQSMTQLDQQAAFLASTTRSSGRLAAALLRLRDVRITRSALSTDTVRFENLAKLNRGPVG